jgi:hypothetical protein
MIVDIGRQHQDAVLQLARRSPRMIINLNVSTIFN